MDERMLRHALMEANLERFRDVLDAAEEQAGDRQGNTKTWL